MKKQAKGMLAAGCIGLALVGGTALQADDDGYLTRWEKYFEGSISGRLDALCRGTEEIVSIDATIIGDQKFLNCEDYKTWRKVTQNSTCYTDGRSGRVQLELGVDVESYRDPAHATGRIAKPAGKYLETVNFEFSLEGGGKTKKRSIGEAKGAMIWRCNTDIGRGDYWNCRTGGRQKGVVEISFGLNNRDELRGQQGVSHFTGHTGELFFMEVSAAEKRQSPFQFGFDDGTPHRRWRVADNARLVGAWRCIQ